MPLVMFSCSHFLIACLLGSTVVDYRVEAMSTQIQDTSSFGSAVGDATALTMGIQSVGAAVTNSAEYSNAAATVTSPPVVQGMAGLDFRGVVGHSISFKVL